LVLVAGVVAVVIWQTKKGRQVFHTSVDDSGDEHLYNRFRNKYCYLAYFKHNNMLLLLLFCFLVYFFLLLCLTLGACIEAA